MSKEQAVQHMVAFIEKKERELQARKFSVDVQQAKSDVVKSIMDELERVMDHENS